MNKFIFSPGLIRAAIRIDRFGVMSNTVIDSLKILNLLWMNLTDEYASAIYISYIQNLGIYIGARIDRIDRSKKGFFDVGVKILSKHVIDPFILSRVQDLQQQYSQYGIRQSQETNVEFLCELLEDQQTRLKINNKIRMRHDTRK